MDIIQLTDENIGPGSVWAMPSDTIYGLSCLAFDTKAVSRLDSIKNRTPDKSYIIMIGDVSQLGLFDIKVSTKIESFLSVIWPGPVSVVVPSIGQSFSYLDGVVEGVAFRLPNDKVLQDLCLEHGPIITTSANRSGMPSILDPEEIQKEFGDEIDFIVTRENYQRGEPSTVIKLLR